MFRQVLLTQWKWARAPLLLAVIAGFAIPLASVQTGIEESARYSASFMLQAMGRASAFYSLLGLSVALVLATSAWAADHRGRHVYALSLPVPRWYYALLRFGAGAVLLAAPAAAVWLGGLVATATVDLPAGLHAYPGALAIRFALAALVAYAIFFAIASGTTRTALYVLGLVTGLVAADAVGSALSRDLKIVETVFDTLVSWPGPFDVFTGRWMLIDV